LVLAVDYATGNSSLLAFNMSDPNIPILANLTLPICYSAIVGYNSNQFVLVCNQWIQILFLNIAFSSNGMKIQNTVTTDFSMYIGIIPNFFTVDSKNQMMYILGFDDGEEERTSDLYMVTVTMSPFAVKTPTHITKIKKSVSQMTPSPDMSFLVASFEDNDFELVQMGVTGTIQFNLTDGSAVLPIQSVMFPGQDDMGIFMEPVADGCQAKLTKIHFRMGKMGGVTTTTDGKACYASSVVPMLTDSKCLYIQGSPTTSSENVMMLSQFSVNLANFQQGPTFVDQANVVYDSPLPMALSPSGHYLAIADLYEVNNKEDFLRISRFDVVC